MSIKKPVIIIVCVALVGAGAFGIKNSLNTAKQLNPSPVAATPTPSPMATELWDDPSGFSIAYPKTIAINKHDEDSVNYAHVEMTATPSAGSIIIWAKDTTAPSVDAYIKADKTWKNALCLDTTLGGKPAKKCLLKEPVETSWVGAIVEGIVYYIESKPNAESFWQDTANAIASSWKWTDASAQTETTSSNDAGGSDDIGIEEEIIE